MTGVGIAAVGAYAPRFRITADEFAAAWGRFQAPGIREKAVPAADEDSLTMAVEAGTRCLGIASPAEPTVDWLGFATTTPPLADTDLTSRLVAMLGLDGDIPTTGFTDSTRAGTRALWAGIDAIEAGQAEIALVIAADAPRGTPDDPIDHAAGAGAAALLLTAAADGTAVSITDRATATDPSPGTRFRRSDRGTSEGLGITHYDRRSFIETIASAVDGLGFDVNPDSNSDSNSDSDSDSISEFKPTAVAIQAPNGKLPYRAAGRVGVTTDAIQAVTTVHTLGDCGAASVPLSLARGLAAGHERILAVGYGSGGGADAFVIESNPDAGKGTTDSDGEADKDSDADSDSSTIPAAINLDEGEPIDYAEYLRQRGVVTSGPPAGGGAYVSIPTWTRSLAQRYRREAGRCPDCGALAFPPEGACPACGSTVSNEPVHLPETATVEAATTISQGGAPPEFAEYQLQAGDYAALIVSFEVKDHAVSVPVMGTGAAPDAFAIGDTVETTIRRIYEQEGVVRYGFKVRPVVE